MARRADHDHAPLLGPDIEKRFGRFTAALVAAPSGRRRLALLADVPTWARALCHAGAPVALDFLEKLPERLRAVILAECARCLAATAAAAKARELARAMLGTDETFVLGHAVRALADLGPLDAVDAAAAASRFAALAEHVDVSSVAALVSLARATKLDELAAEQDRRAQAIFRLALARRAAETGELARGRELVAKVTRDVVELRVKRRNTDATRVFCELLPLVASFHATDADRLESLIEDPVIAWTPYAAQEALTAFAGATTKLADSKAALASLEQNARLVLRRIRHEDKTKMRILFEGLAACARSAALLGDPKPLVERIAAGARESLLIKAGLFTSDPLFFEYRALLGCGEALARTGDRAALDGAIAALGEVRDELVPFLFDDALAAAHELEAPDVALRALDVARKRLDEPPIARWIATLALRAHEVTGRERVLERWQRAEERRLRALQTASLR